MTMYKFLIHYFQIDPTKSLFVRGSVPIKFVAMKDRNQGWNVLMRISSSSLG